MSGFTSIPDAKQIAIQHLLEGTINRSHLPKSGKKFPVGATVQLEADDTVDGITTGEKLYGTVIVQEQKSGKVTVKTNLAAIIGAVAKGAGVTRGALLKEIPADTITNEKLTVSVAASTNYATHIALTTGADGAEVMVGLLLAPIVKS